MYSTLARALVNQARIWARQRGYSDVPSGIREFRRAVMTLDDSDPMKIRLTGCPHFYSMSGCRDLVFHVQEHTFTLLELADVFHRLKLTVLQVDVKSAAHSTAYRERFPEDTAATELALATSAC